MTADTSSPPPATPPRLTPRALYEDVAEQLRQRIFQRELKPGTWIDEVKLAQEYGISRTPMREALKVLAAEGLVTMKMRRGAYVTEVSEQDIRHIYHLLALLEADASADLALHASPADLNSLKHLHQQLEAATTHQAQFFALNEQFHLLVLQLAGNTWRQQLVTDLRKVMKLHRHHSLFKSGRIDESLAEHQGWLQAILSGDAENARRAVQQHFENGLTAAM